MSQVSSITTLNIPGAIAREVEREIISGVYAPGQRLIERDLASRFKVSTIPVREALQALEGRGLVRRAPNRGCSVIDLAPSEIERCGELRALLEPQVIRWAAERIVPGAREELELQLEKLRVAAEAGNYADFFFEDLELHRMIWEQSQNTFAAAALGTTIGSLFASGLRESQGVDLMEEHRKHVRMVEAVIKGEADKAAETLGEISRGFQEHLRKRNADATS